MYKHGFNKREEKNSIKRAFYNRWQSMRTRCTNSNRKDWRNYGGKGITICLRWRNFEHFKQDMFETFKIHLSKFGRKDTTLERINSAGNYCKNNCRWATKLEQGRNTRVSKLISYQGRTYHIWELTVLFNRPYITIYSRLKRGIPLDQPYRKSVTE